MRASRSTLATRLFGPSSTTVTAVEPPASIDVPAGAPITRADIVVRVREWTCSRTDRSTAVNVASGCTNATNLVRRSALATAREAIPASRSPTDAPPSATEDPVWPAPAAAMAFVIWRLSVENEGEVELDVVDLDVDAGVEVIAPAELIVSTASRVPSSRSRTNSTAADLSSASAVPEVVARSSMTRTTSSASELTRDTDKSVPPERVN